MGHRTPLFDVHVAAKARMVDFGGFDMPVNYGSQIEEHHAVRRDAGMFDVSHMCIIDLQGPRTRELLQFLLANDVAKLVLPGKALYSCMLNEKGGVIDDLIVYFQNNDWFRVVVNAGTQEKDIAWIKQHAPAFQVTVNVRKDLAMVAVQGPNARAKAAPILDLLKNDLGKTALGLKPFFSTGDANYFVAWTGYTGEDGLEIMLPSGEVAALWAKLLAAGVAQCGLGARDTLRLEAGMNLYGNDMDETVSPLESGLTWTVALEAQIRAGVPRKLVGLLLEDRGVLRGHQKVIVAGIGEGELTSGTFSPTLERSIGFARVPANTGDQVQVDIRGKLLPARVVQYPFARNGKAKIPL